MSISRSNYEVIDSLNNELNSVFYKCTFFNNSSPHNSAGAIFIDDTDVDIIDSSFISNEALIGGAIRIITVNVVPLFYLSYL